MPTEKSDYRYQNVMEYLFNLKREISLDDEEEKLNNLKKIQSELESEKCRIKKQLLKKQLEFVQFKKGITVKKIVFNN